MGGFIPTHLNVGSGVPVPKSGSSHLDGVHGSKLAFFAQDRQARVFVPGKLF